MHKITREQMLEYVSDARRRGSIYVWGAQGQTGGTITEAWIRDMETNSTNAARAIATWNRNKKSYDPAHISAYDCSGLIAACINANGNPGWDDTADGLRQRCTKITERELVAGDFVFEWNGTRSGHVGVYIGDGHVIEARGRDYGVVKTALADRHWARYGRPDWLYTQTIDTEPVAETGLPYDFSRCASRGERSERVRWIQQRLIRHSAMEAPETDYFGTVTQAAVRTFQAARIAEGRDVGCKEPDGIVGPKTAAILAE